MCSFFCEVAFPCSVGPVGMLTVDSSSHALRALTRSVLNKNGACATPRPTHFEKALTFLPNPAVDWQIEDFNDKGAGPWTFFLPFWRMHRPIIPAKGRGVLKAGCNQSAGQEMSTFESGSVESVRRSFAEELCRVNGISSAAICAAFATVPRERFAGPGPWTIQSSRTSWFTEDSDPRRLYRDALIVLDEAKRLNNGQPSLWAIHLDLLGVRLGDQVLHLGCGAGYYTAILAELTGPEGKVTAVEIDDGLAARARVALEAWPQVTVIHTDGSKGPFEPADVIVVSAGATHPLSAWLAALKPEGKLLFPLTSTQGPGTMAYVTRKGADQFAARLCGTVFFVDFAGARDPEAGRELATALKRDEGYSVRSLRCDPHGKDESCWLHGKGWCFSRCAPIPTGNT